MFLAGSGEERCRIAHSRLAIVAVFPEGIVRLRAKQTSHPPPPTHTHTHTHTHTPSTAKYRLVGLVVKASASSAADPGSIPALDVSTFPDRVIPVA